MAKQDNVAKAPKKERVVLTPEQRIAKAEAELAELRRKAEEKANKGRTVAMEKRAKLVARRDKIQSDIDAIDAEYPPAETTTVGDTADEPDTDEL